MKDSRGGTLDVIRDAMDPATRICAVPVRELAERRGLALATVRTHIVELREEGKLVAVGQGRFAVAEEAANGRSA